MIEIEEKLLAEVLDIASRGLHARRDLAQDLVDSEDQKQAVHKIVGDRGKVFQARRVLQGEQEPTFDPDEQQTGETA